MNNMMDMNEEAQELCEKSRASVATEDCMDAAYKLCDLQVLLVRMEYEAKKDDVAVTQKENLNSIPVVVCPSPMDPAGTTGIGHVYPGQTSVSVKDNLNVLAAFLKHPFDPAKGILSVKAAKADIPAFAVTVCTRIRKQHRKSSF